DVPGDVAAMLGEIQYGIADNLPGTMIGDVAASVRGVKFHVQLLEQSLAGVQMIASSVSPKRDHVRVLADQQDVWNRLGFAGLDELALQLTRRPVGDSPQVHHPTGCLRLFHAPHSMSASRAARSVVDGKTAHRVEGIA